jgi:hypothetical protein
MRTLSCYVALASVVAVAMSCGGDSGGGPSGAASVTGISGNNQTGPTGAQLEFPLGLVVLGSNGQPVSGVVVSWSVPIGQATLGQSLDTSDVSGAVGNAVTLGAQTGQLVVRATIPGISAPVDFHHTVVSPCAFRPVQPVPGNVNGQLTNLDCNLTGGGWLYDLFDVTSPTQRGITTTMSSTAFNAYLEMFTIRNGFYEYIALNDNADTTTSNATIHIITGPGAPAIIGANTYLSGATGPYTLTTANRPQTLAGCFDEVWVTRGVTIPETIATTDCPDSTPGGVFYADVAGIIAYDPTVLTISQRSTAIDPFLTLFQIDTAGLVAVASNDDSLLGTNTNAFIQYAVTTPAVYLIVASTSPAAQTGAYTLEVSSSVTASTPVFSAPPRRTRSSQFLRQHTWRPLRIEPRPSVKR